MEQKPIEKALRSRLAALNERLREKEDMARAFRTGEVDAVVVLKKSGADVYSIHSDEPLYRTLVEELPHGVATLLGDGTIVYANRHLSSRIERSGGDALGRSLIDCVVPADRGRFTAMLRAALDAPQELETTFRWGNDECPALVSALRLPVADVEAIGLALVDLRDRDARRSAEESSRAKDDLLASVSHELRTPLTSMMGWVQLLELEFEAEGRSSDTIRNLKKAVMAESAIVDDLLDVSRMTRGSLSIAAREFDVFDALRTAISFVALQALNRGVELRLDIADVAASALGDGDRLRQVFVNILTNAIKFTESGGYVTVRARCDDDGVTVAVSDTGRGISADFLPEVFEPFRRGEGTTWFPGLGIGLSIARGLIEAHGGTITAASDGLGCGATFTVRLPTARC